MIRLLVTALLAFAAPFAAAQEARIATLHAAKIYCEACAAVITKALRNVPGVAKVDVDVEKKEVMVQFDPSRASLEDLTAATAKRGFPSSIRQVTP